ncbi:MAG: hypothetical protein ACHQ49_12825 [Elusimicrobiota bacterium]
MGLLLAAFLMMGGPAMAADAKADAAATADKGTIDLVNYFLKVDLADANTKLVDEFLAVKTDTLPKKLRGKAAAKQIEITALLRIHDVKKKGIFVQQPAQECNEKDFVKPLSMAGFFYGYEVVNEDELKYVMDKTKCTEIDLGCRFSMLIFFEKKKDRVIKFNANDPIMALVAESHAGGGTTKFFGMGFTCMH